MYARILFEVDLTRPMPKIILVTKRKGSNGNEFEFFVDIEFESLPKFSELHRIIGYDLMSSRRRGVVDKNIVEHLNEFNAQHGFKHVQYATHSENKGERGN